MIALDVNVLVSAFHAGTPDHAPMRRWLEDAVNGSEQVAVSDAVLAGVVRVLTHPRVFDPPADVGEVVAQVDALLAHPGVVVVRPLPGHWAVFRGLLEEGAARGNRAADAHHAATALQHGATFVSKDRDFARFRSLTWRVPPP